MRRVLVPLVAVTALARGDARATYSIVATDSATRQVGGAGTSCVGGLSVRVIYGSAPGHGAVHAQAYFNVNGRDRAASRLAADVPPDEILAEITDPAFDPMAAFRQYGIADLAGRAAGWTGSSTQDYTEDRQGQIETFTYSVQGNILTSAAVIDQAQMAFETEGCDLADRLMLALEAGAENGEGDGRCTPSGIPSDSAFLQVDREGEPAGSWLALDVTDTAPESPLVPLRAAYDAWRQANPCPIAAPPDAGPAEGDAGDPGAGGGDGGCSCSAGGRRDVPWGGALALLVIARIAATSRGAGHRAASRPRCDRAARTRTPR